MHAFITEGALLDVSSGHHLYKIRGPPFQASCGTGVTQQVCPLTPSRVSATLIPRLQDILPGRPVGQSVDEIPDSIMHGRSLIGLSADCSRAAFNMHTVIEEVIRMSHLSRVRS